MVRASNVFLIVNLTGLYPKPMPLWLVSSWSVVGVGLLVFLAVWSWQLHRRMQRKMQ